VKIFTISQAAIEYSSTFIEAETAEEAIRKAKEEPQDWSFGAYEEDGMLEELTGGKFVEYQVEDEAELVCESCGVEGGHRADCKTAWPERA